MKEVKIVTVKPESGEVEYGVKEGDTWLVHGIVIQQALGPTTTGQQLLDAAIADANQRGLLA